MVHAKHFNNDGVGLEEGTSCQAEILWNIVEYRASSFGSSAATEREAASPRRRAWLRNSSSANSGGRPLPRGGAVAAGTGEIWGRSLLI